MQCQNTGEKKETKRLWNRPDDESELLQGAENKGEVEKK